METIKALIKKLQDFIEKSNISGVIIAIISFLFIVLFSIFEPYNTFENKLYDIKFKMKPSIEQLDSLIFIDVDDNSIFNVGQYPWPRYHYNNGLQVLTEVGVRQAAFDMEFQNNSPKMLNPEGLTELKEKASKSRIAQNELDSIVLDNDRLLAEGIKTLNRVILPYHFEYDMPIQQEYDEAYKKELADARKIFERKATVKVPEKEWDKYKGLEEKGRVAVTIPIPELIRVAHGFGYVDRDTDSDGTERRIRLVRFFQGRLYFQMALSMLMDICGVKKEDLVIQPGKSIILKGAINPVTFEKKDIVIPIDKNGKMYINWAGKGRLEHSFQHLPYFALFEYPRVKETVQDFFRQAEEESGKNERSAVIAELEKAENEFYSADKLEVKKEK